MIHQKETYQVQKEETRKRKTAAKCVQDFQTFVIQLRFQFSAPKEWDGLEDFESIWETSPPESRYNMAQVPLPFVNGQDLTFTTEDDVDVDIKYPK